jgi:2-polyprenyl-3-methyl-5-hydroxy-6-metoxy-1,4-benzoquinol methylase
LCTSATDLTQICPICDSIRKRTRLIGDLAVATCSSCGHGWLIGLQQENAHYETSHYINWRSENRVATHRRANQYLADLRSLVPKKPLTAIEVGCSTGEVIGLLAERGVRGWGADTSEPAIRQARARFPQVSFTVGPVPAPDEPVDVALMMHVIEHVPDPIGVLRDIRSLVADNGFIYIRTPNYAGAAAQLLRGAWPDFLVDHLHYFTRRSIEQALTVSGWCAENVRTKGGAWVWLGGAKRIIRRQRPSRAKGTGAPPGPNQMRILSAAQKFARPLWSIEGRSGRGNELVISARRALS